MNNAVSNDSCCSNSSNESSDDDLFSILQMAESMHEMDEEIALANHNYFRDEKMMAKIIETAQGVLFRAKNQNTNKYVAIKKVSKQLALNHECVDKMDPEFKYIIDKDIVKESMILRYINDISNENKQMNAINDSIVKYIDFFETETDYYSVMEYIESNMNLKQFVIKSHDLIKKKKLTLKHYRKIVKYILWQLINVINWLHNSIHCCHLDICPENIMLKNMEFITNSNGSVTINPNVKVILTDFGVSELFQNVDRNNDFQCQKQQISIDNTQYIAPNIQTQMSYDAKAADMWSFGIITYFCFIGQFPYKQTNEELLESDFSECDESMTDYYSICKNKLKQWLAMNNLLSFISPNILKLINGLLNIKENKRLKSVNVLKHPYFRSYHRNTQRTR